jgi:hypothetical protein
VEEKIGDITEKQQEIMRIIELVKPLIFIDEVLVSENGEGKSQGF